MPNKPRSEKHEAARSDLAEDLVPVFDEHVNYFRFSAAQHHGSPLAGGPYLDFRYEGPASLSGYFPV